jgi:phage terminase small subunit
VPLTAKQQRFVEEYLVDLNATQAAIRAGYPAEYANKIGPENLVNVGISDAISAGREKMSQRTEITQDMVMAEFARIGFGDIRALFDTSGRLKALADLPRDHAAMVASIEVVTKSLPGREGEPVEVEYTHKIRSWDKVAALTQMGRRLGMFVDKLETRDTTNLAVRLKAAKARKK